MTHDFQVTKRMKLTSTDLNDILCSAFEGGCGYWCQIDNTTEDWKTAKSQLQNEQPDEKCICIEDVMVYMLEHDYAIKLFEDEDDDGEYEVEHDLTINNLINGITLAIANGYWDGQDTGDVDGEIGDIIIQYALFKDVVYG